MAIPRTPIIDDDGTGSTGTILNNSWKQELYDQIDAADVAANGPSNAPVVFPAVAVPSANANTLDDYREGNWTPAFLGTGGQSGQAYSQQIGKYIKIGRFVLVQGRISLSTLGTFTGQVTIGDLPFVADPAALASCAAVVGYFAGLAAALANVTATINPNATRAALWGVAAGGATAMAAITQASITAAFDVIFVGMYIAKD